MKHDGCVGYSGRTSSWWYGGRKEPIREKQFASQFDPSILANDMQRIRLSKYWLMTKGDEQV